MVIKDKGNSLENTSWENMQLEQILEDVGMNDFSAFIEVESTKVIRPSKEKNSETKTESGKNKVETMDRGVGPSSPVPTTPGFSTVTAPPFSPFFGWPPYFVDPRSGMFDPTMGCPNPFLYPPFGYPAYNPSLPINSSTNEGRYHWPLQPSSNSMAFHGSSSHRSLRGSPTLSDLPSASMQGSLPGRSPADFDLRMQWERASAFHQRHGFSSNAAGLSGGHYTAQSPFGPYPSMSSHRVSVIGEHPATPASGSITLPGSLQSSRLTTPWPSLRSNRKRAFSHSPSELGIDLDSLTRSSEASLQFPPIGRESMGSSTASGSYGHLSAVTLGSFSPSFGVFGRPRHGSISGMIPPNLPPGMIPPTLPGMLPPSAFYNPMLHPGFNPYLAYAAGSAQAPSFSQVNPPSAAASSGSSKNAQVSTTTRDVEHETGFVSSTVQGSSEEKTKFKKEADFFPFSDPKLVQTEGRDGECPSPSDHMLLQEGEPDFYETNCHWKGCSREFPTQDELVKHLNQDHIAMNKRMFICQWVGCVREEKPFKAQYMLVVHMRRHTGEKPHKCLYQGCNKAYSRLENLKTHMRSHTGEKPYLCEIPGCKKAFSNASDRAKHQNRTHSNTKPYVCKAKGCLKRYTDPSSLRKHVKTVHGVDFYTSKKHKGENCDDDDGYGGGATLTGRSNQEVVSNENSPGSQHEVHKVEDCLTVTSLQHHRTCGNPTEQNQVKDCETQRTAYQKSPGRSKKKKVPTATLR